MCSRPTHHRPIDARRHSCPGSGRHRSVSDLPRVFRLVALPRPMGALEAVRGNCPRRTRQTTPDRWKNSASEPPMGRGSRTGMLHSDSRPGIATMFHRHGHYETAPRPHRCNAFDCNPCIARPSDSPLKCRPESAATVRKKRLGHHGSRLSAPKPPATKGNTVARR